MNAQTHQPPTSLGLWIRQRRRMLDITQEALASAASLSVSAIRKIEADERHPSLSVAEALANALQIPEPQRALFVRVARQETRIDQLAGIAAPTVPPMRSEPDIGGLLVPQFDPERLDVQGHEAASRSASVSILSDRLTALPSFPTPLVGREAEIGQVRSILLNPECRLLSLTGAGGIGKTRLAVAAAAQLAPEFADGVIYVALAAVDAGQKPLEQSAPSIVETSNPLAAAIANVLYLRAQNPGELQTRIVAYLAERHMLLLLDNLEHLLEGGVEVIAAILDGAPNIKVIATTREQLNLQSEWVFNVRGLGAPASVASTWESSSAMRLFVQSARRAVVGFDPTPGEIAAIADICRRVDGIPLAVELAASWVRVLTCAEIAEEIARDWTFLSGASRDMPERHRSMRAVFEQSWRFLTQSEKRLLRHLSVFRGGFRRDAAQAVAGATLQDLAGLVAKSLVNSQGGDRYDMHQLVRHFAGEELDAAGESDSARDRHAVWYIELATSSEDALHGPQQIQWLQRLDADLQNFEGALRWVTGDRSTIAAGEGWRMISALWWFCFVRGYWNDLYNWLVYFYRLDPPVDPAVRAIAIGRTGNLAWLRGETALAEELVAESLEAAQRSSNGIAIAMGWYAVGQVYSQSDPPRSQAAYEETLAITRRMGRKWGEGRSLFRVGTSAMNNNDLDLALRYFEEALAIFRHLGDVWGIYAVLSGTVDLYLRQGKPELVSTLGQESLAHARSLGFRQGMALEVLSLGMGAWQQGQTEEARDWFEEARRLFAEIDNQRGVAQTELQLGNTALAEAHFAEARTHFANASEITNSLGIDFVLVGALYGMAMLAFEEGDLLSAQAKLVESALLQQATPGLRHAFTSIFEGGARIAAARRNQYARAALLLGATDAARRRYAYTLPPIEVPPHDETMRATREALGEDEFSRLFAQGAALDEDEVIELLK